jgi:hypothetical protein
VAAGKGGTLTLTIDGRVFHISLTGPLSRDSLEDEINESISGYGNAYIDGSNLLIITSATTGSSSSVKVSGIAENSPGDLSGLHLSVGDMWTGTDSATGLATLMDSFLDAWCQADGVISSKYNMLGRQILDINGRIEDLEDRLAVHQERIWNQFAYVEKIISDLQSQSAWLTQMFNMMSGGSQSSSSSSSSSSS